MDLDRGPLLIAGFFGPILLGVAVLVTLRLVYGPPDRSRDDPLHMVLSVVGWVLITMSFVGPVFLGLFGFGGVLMWVFALVVLIIVFYQNRVAQQRALLWVLTVASERLMPLVPAIEAFAQERWGAIAKRAGRLAELLKSGMPLPEALRSVPGVLPARLLPTIHVACESGALAAALREAATAGSEGPPLWRHLAIRIAHLCLLLLFGMMILTFIMLQIVPAFEKIFSDFGVPLPPLTRSLIIASHFVYYYWYLLVLLLPAGFLLFFFVMLRMGRRTGWALPGEGLLGRRLDTATILEALALAADRQRPMTHAITALAESYHKLSVRRRLGRVLGDVHSGADWGESLLVRGLLRRADLAVLQAAQRVGNLPWALREMAASSRRRMAYRLAALVQVLMTVVVVAAGLVVMWVVVSLFLPLVTLIRHLA